MTSPSTLALRYRIWAYASPREWNVTTAEVGEAMGISTDRARAVINGAGWSNRIRALATCKYDNAKDGFHATGTAAAARYISADIVAGKIGNDAPI
jgi:hypothetical protein